MNTCYEAEAEIDYCSSRLNYFWGGGLGGSKAVTVSDVAACSSVDLGCLRAGGSEGR